MVAAAVVLQCVNCLVMSGEEWVRMKRTPVYLVAYMYGYV